VSDCGIGSHNRSHQTGLASCVLAAARSVDTCAETIIFLAGATQNEQEPRQRYARGEGAKLRVDLLNAAAELMATHESTEAISLRAAARRASVSPNCGVSPLRRSCRLAGSSRRRRYSGAHLDSRHRRPRRRQSSDGLARHGMAVRRPERISSPHPRRLNVVTLWPDSGRDNQVMGFGPRSLLPRNRAMVRNAVWATMRWSGRTA
jgi:hypothetical protein